MYTYDTTLTIFDWDDTLMCSSFIQQTQYKGAACRALRLAQLLGQVVIITNAEHGWVELCAQRYLRGVNELLEDIPVVSARTRFEAQFPGSPVSWKAAAFAYVLHEQFSAIRNKPKLVVSIGDSEEERAAVRIAAAQHAMISSCTVKFLPQPMPRALAVELDMVTTQLRALCRGIDASVEAYNNNSGSSSSNEMEPYCNATVSYTISQEAVTCACLEEHARSAALCSKHSAASIAAAAAGGNAAAALFAIA
ncbi:hypothetical protein JKP88DRAFT_263538 [Tribonema minus]|uniref:Uncharacterized protein n=1 Tax=Tribonema minus TaxID=303371 RepID=A0A836CF50_9STRA|nr:hypothetical protein JKP88DRAFT_263538 [Tribonema minus]